MIHLSCVGDSITRAQFSVDYLQLLTVRHPTERLTARRFATNGDFAYNLLQRLDEVVSAPADLITVLIGTNDARASLAGYPIEQIMKRKQLPTRPSAAWYQECLDTIVERLRTETHARIALLSLPVLGQDLSAAPAGASKSYSRMIAEAAAAHGVAYVPLHERQRAELRRCNPPQVRYQEPTIPGLVRTMLQRKVLRRSLDSIADRRRLLLTTDHVHQNSRGAGLIAEAIDECLLRSNR